MAEMESPCALDGDTNCGLLGLDEEKRVCYVLNRAKDECSVWIQERDDSICCSQCEVCPEGCGVELAIDCSNANAMTAFLLNTECNCPLDPTLGTTSRPTGCPAPSQATCPIVPPSPGRTPIPKYPSTFWPTPCPTPLPTPRLAPIPSPPPHLASRAKTNSSSRDLSHTKTYSSSLTAADAPTYASPHTLAHAKTFSSSHTSSHAPTYAPPPTLQPAPRPTLRPSLERTHQEPLGTIRQSDVISKAGVSPGGFQVGSHPCSQQYFPEQYRKPS